MILMESEDKKSRLERGSVPLFFIEQLIAFD